MSSHNKGKQSADGFTLIEVVIAVAIFAIIATMSIGGLKAVLMANQVTSVNADQLNQLQLAMLIMERDIEQMTNRPVIDQNNETIAAVIAIPHYLEFTHAGYANPFAQKNRSTLQRVAYTLQNGNLVRIIWPVLDRAPNTTPVTQVLLNRIASVDFQLMDSEQQFHTTWPLANLTNKTQNNATQNNINQTNATQNTTNQNIVNTNNSPTTNQSTNNQNNAHLPPAVPIAVKLILTLSKGGTITRLFVIPGQQLDTPTITH